MVGEGEEKGVIEETERDMITNILDFKDTTAGETMTHRTDIIAVEDTDTIAQVVEASVENGCSRMPVYHEDIDTVVGICYIKDLLPYVGRPVPEFIKITDLMRPGLLCAGDEKVQPAVHRDDRAQGADCHCAGRVRRHRRGSSPWRTWWRTLWATSRTSTTTRRRKSTG